MDLGVAFALSWSRRGRVRLIWSRLSLQKGPPEAGGPSSRSLPSYAAQSRRMRSSSVSLGL
jgi:hypothetical protein